MINNKMSKKLQLKNLQMPKCSRDDSNSMVSRFFSQKYQTEKTASACSKTRLSSSQPESMQSSEIKENKKDKECSFKKLSKSESDTTTEYSTQKDCQISEAHEKCEPEYDDEGKKNLEAARQNSSSTLKRKTSSSNQNTIKKFFNKSANDSDFVTPPKQQKKKFAAPKLNDRQQEKKGVLKKRKKQPKINNMLLQNEMMFSKMITHQSIAENVNPDDMQLALALSRSEIETNHITDYHDDECDMNEPIAEDSPMNVNKLKKFEYKSSRSNNVNNDNNFNLFVPNKSRGKWANRFAPLTLRNPERQHQKLLENVEKFLRKQEQLDAAISSKKIKSIPEQPIILTSDYLKNLISTENRIFYSCSANDDDISSYYVTELFTPTNVKAGYLLKDYRRIPGRELSPEPFIADNQLSKSGDKIKDVIETVGKQQQEDQRIISTETQKNISPAVPLSNDADTISSSQSKNNGESFYKKPEDELIISGKSSPDLFADYDDIYTEGDAKAKPFEMEKIQIDEKITDLEENDMQFYENYSSDEGKKINTKNNPMFSNKTKNHKDPEKDSEEWSQQLAMEENTENHEEIEQTIKEDVVNNSSTRNDNFIDLTTSSPSKSENESESNSSSSVTITGEYISRESLDVCNTSQKNSCRDPLHRSFSAIYSKDKRNSIHNIDQHEGLSNSRRSSLFRKCTSEINFHSTFNDENEKDQFTQKGDFSQSTSVDDDVIILSDDEVNYSIRKIKNKIFESNIDEDVMNYKSVLNDFNRSISVDSNSSQEQKTSDNECSLAHNFSLLDLISEKNKDEAEVNQLDEEDVVSNVSDQEAGRAQLKLDEILLDSPNEKEREQELCKQNNEELDDSFFDLKKLKAQFGILDERTPIKVRKCTEIVTKSSSKSCRKSLSESFSKPSTSSFVNKNETKSFQPFSSNKKFEEFIHEDFDEFDEFDKLVYGSPTKPAIETPTKPQGLEKLLTGEINLITEEKPSEKDEDEERPFTEIECDDQIYLVQLENVPKKPDYENMDLSTLHKELSKYGVKPLKRKQAIILLNYIYEQTHPIIDDLNLSESDDGDQDHNTKKMKNYHENKKIKQREQEKKTDKIEMAKTDEEKYNNFELKDCFGDVLLKVDGIQPEIDNEEYFLPTNVRSKVLTAALPFHIAWFNLVKSNLKLRESLLHYEPIDLQEIYLFLKKIGFRYNPKDMKKFFDSRCIVFRYDLCEGNNNRHTRKLLPRKPR